MTQLAHEQNLHDGQSAKSAAGGCSFSGVASRKGGDLAQGPLQRAVGVGYYFLDGNHVAASIGAAQHDACSAAAHQLHGAELVGQDERMLWDRWSLGALG